MKKTGFLILIVLALTGCKSGEKYDVVGDDFIESLNYDPAHNSRNSLDWAGVYEYTAPCEDCDGIRTVFTINEDQTYELTQTYLGENERTGFQASGDFSWNEAGSRIIIKPEDLIIQFNVGENYVSLADMKGNVSTRKVENFYILRKK